MVEVIGRQGKGKGKANGYREIASSRTMLGEVAQQEGSHAQHGHPCRNHGHRDMSTTRKAPQILERITELGCKQDAENTKTRKNNPKPTNRSNFHTQRRSESTKRKSQWQLGSQDRRIRPDILALHASHGKDAGRLKGRVARPHCRRGRRPTPAFVISIPINLISISILIILLVIIIIYA